MSEHNSGAREMLASRLGFILLTAGCAVGLGNIWRFPYIAGQYGGAFFVLMYLFFLVLLGFPVMVMELSIGRAGRLDIVGCYKKLKSPERPLPWEKPGMLFFSGNMILLMFYTAITGWLLAYTWYFLTGTFSAIGCPGVFQLFSCQSGEADPVYLYRDHHYGGGLHCRAQIRSGACHQIHDGRTFHPADRTGGSGVPSAEQYGRSEVFS